MKEEDLKNIFLQENSEDIEGIHFVYDGSNRAENRQLFINSFLCFVKKEESNK
jgi:hypothetical protein